MPVHPDSTAGGSAALPATPARRKAGLVYVTDTLPGITRHPHRGRFRYRNARGEWLCDRQEIRRIRRLAIPPAYTDVWICPLANGHLQATGRDARGRKQYRYHAEWRAQRDEGKFDRMQAFGRALPRIRARVARDLPGQGARLGRTQVLATLVRLLDTTFVRIGNDEYARTNGSYGLTTLQNRHAGVRGSVLRLTFRGKSGVMHHIELDDPKIAAVVRRCQQLPGQELFQYLDEDGQPHTLGSADVNDYLARICAGTRANEGEGDALHFTAKDFRTWHGTVQALELTRLACSGQSAGALPYSARSVLAEVARRLGNTPAVCRKAYIHPAVMALGASLTDDDNAQALWRRLDAGRRPRGLQAAENRLLAFLHDHQRQRKAGARVVRRLPAVSTHAARQALAGTARTNAP